MDPAAAVATARSPPWTFYGRPLNDASDKPIPISAELRPFVDRSEAAEIDAVADRLRAGRPTPDPAFRAALGEALSGRGSRLGAGLSGPRLRLSVAALAGSGALLLLASYLIAR